VIDHKLRVYGVSGLRVADAAIMPTVVSGNTNAACIMVGEKCADLMLATRCAQACAGPSISAYGTKPPGDTVVDDDGGDPPTGRPLSDSSS
jgi:choline dehydrogenase-like flavoprotein